MSIWLSDVALENRYLFGERLKREKKIHFWSLILRSKVADFRISWHRFSTIFSVWNDIDSYLCFSQTFFSYRATSKSIIWMLARVDGISKWFIDRHFEDLLGIISFRNNSCDYWRVEKFGRQRDIENKTSIYCLY